MVRHVSLLFSRTCALRRRGSEAVQRALQRLMSLSEIPTRVHGVLNMVLLVCDAGRRRRRRERGRQRRQRKRLGERSRSWRRCGMRWHGARQRRRRAWISSLRPLRLLRFRD